jgi:hypothetical protein
MMKTLLLFGASGTIASEIRKKFRQQNWRIIGVGRSFGDGVDVVWDPLTEVRPNFESGVCFDAICWAQGMNLNDSIASYMDVKHQEVYRANVVYILNSLHYLKENKALSSQCKLCIVSSIWQNISRQNKLTYGVTKAAIKGLVLSLANDLAAEGCLVNAVLPGAIDTPMTRANLLPEQISKIESSTGFNRLASLEDIANTVYLLNSELNTGITANFITVDLGFSHVRNI